MPLRFVSDEHLRGKFPRAVRHHNDGGGHPVDLTTVGDPPDLPLGTPDPAVLAWAEENDRILITHDVGTMPGHLADHLAAGRHSPGVMVLRDGFSLAEIVAYLELAAHAGDPADYADAVTYIP